MLVESKSNLARLMATENLFIEQRNVQTAYFDLKNRVLTVPVLNGNLSNEIIDLMLGHEVSHALETPEQGWHDSVVDLKVNRSILNVCEDVRIEKKIKRKFPGIRISFLKGYQELMDMDFFGVKDKNLNKLNFIDRVNLYTKGGPAQGINFTEKEYELVKEVELAETFEETVKVAIKIQKFMKEKPKPPMQKVEMDPEDMMDGSAGPGSGSGEMDDEESETVETQPGKSKSEKTESQKGEEKSEETESSGETGAGIDASNGPETIDSETDRAFREREKELYKDKKSKDIVYCNIPDINLDKVILSHKTLIDAIEKHNVGISSFNPELLRSNFSKFRNESNKVVSHLVKEFEMRKNAEKQARAKISKTGELNLSKIHEYKFTDDIFARMTNVPNGKSHGLVMFIDWSGSMAGHIHSTIKQLLNLVLFCKKVNIPFEVYAFTSVIPNEHEYANRYAFPVQHSKVGDIHVPAFSLMNILSHKMSPKEFMKMSSYLLEFHIHAHTKRYSSNIFYPDIMSLSGTPLNEAIIAAFKLIPEFKKQNKLQIVNTVFLTDGEGYGLNQRIESVNGNMSEVRPWNSRNILRDTVTRATCEVRIGDNQRSSAFGSAQTIALLELFKQRAECNVVGFYIASTRDIRSAIGSYSPKSTPTQVESIVEDFKKNNFTYLNNVGYDEYYFLKSDALDTDDEEDSNVFKKNDSKTTRGLVSAFSKYTSNRVSNRILLNRFIKLIS